MDKDAINVLGGGSKTPPSDTLVNNKDIFMTIDWFTCTFDFIQLNYNNAPSGSWQEIEYIEGIKKLDELYKLLTFGDVSDREYNKINISGYRDGYITLGEYIKIYFTGSPNKNGLNHNKLEMTGSACENFLERGGNFYKLFSFLLKNGANFTRVDCALDIFSTKYFTIKKLLDYTSRYSYVSSLNDWSYMYGGKKSSESFTGETLYFGSKKSNTLICVYDKKLEQFVKGIEILEEAWLRFEIRFKKDRANWFVYEYLNHTDNCNDFSFIANALFTLLDFKDQTKDGKFTNDSNKSRWDTAPWWLEFINSATKVDFSFKEKPKQTLEKKIDWVDRSVSKSLSQIFHNDPENFMLLIYQLVDKKDIDFDNQDLAILNNYREKKNLPLLTMEDILYQQEMLKNVIKAISESEDNNE